MGSDIAGFRDRNAAGCIDQGKLLGLLLGIASKLFALLRDLMLEDSAALAV